MFDRDEKNEGEKEILKFKFEGKRKEIKFLNFYFLNQIEEKISLCLLFFFFHFHSF